MRRGADMDKAPCPAGRVIDPCRRGPAEIRPAGIGGVSRTDAENSVGRMVGKQGYAMHIAITTLPGYTPEEKKRLARALKETAASIGVASFTVSVSVRLK